jgi:cytochrome c oxidase assembly factor 5
MSNFCEPLLQALKDCVLNSDCVLKDGNLPSECMKNHADKLPEDCKRLRMASFECKRGMVRGYSAEELERPLTLLQLDMRKRFRGNSAAMHMSPPGTSAREREAASPSPTGTS